MLVRNSISMASSAFTHTMHWKVNLCSDDKQDMLMLKIGTIIRLNIRGSVIKKISIRCYITY
jgi:hypothetical protein